MRSELLKDLVWGLGPDEGLGVPVVVLDRAAYGLLQLPTDRKTPRRMPLRVMVEKKPSTALSQDADVGVKWNTQRG